MNIYPAIDLKGGQAVRLRQGDMDRATVFDTDPAARARTFAAAGAAWLHVVDLDGAIEGRAVNAATVAAIRAAFPGKLQLGGGIRDMAGIERWLDAGVDRVILGTVAVRDPDLVTDACARFPDRVAVGIDAKGGKVAVAGWVETADIETVELAKRFEGAGVAAVIHTDIDRDGLLQGVNVVATAALALAVDIPVIASGGVGGIEDVEAVQAAPAAIEGVIIGRALYDGRVDLAQALKVAGRC